jgi:7-cyano-7-deazaguanine reductase
MKKTTLSQTGDLKSLGSSKTDYSDHYNPKVLEAFPNQFPQQDYRVELVCPEFTALCPMTGQPDFGVITIRYAPSQWLVESKSLKLYLFSFRSRDLFDLMQPKWLEVEGKFNPRGGISIHPFVRLEHQK